MGRILSVLLWSAVFLLLLVGLDQLLLRVPARQPAHLAVATFYRDLRVRIIALATGDPPAPASTPALPAKALPPASARPATPAAPASVEAVIGQRQERREALPPGAAEAKSRKAPAAPRYVYVDDRGELHFAGTLAEIPEEYRSKAKRLGE